jgi:hypothetical protein
MPPTPSRTVSQRIQTSQIRPKLMAASDSVSATWLIRLRWAYFFSRRRIGQPLHEGFTGAGHDLAPSFLRSWASSSLDKASTTKVMKNSTSPR